MSSVKTLAQSEDLKSLPSDYSHFKNQEKFFQAGSDVTIPIIDFSLLSSTDTSHRAKAVHDLGKACEEWGFFMVVNHEIPETLTNSLLEVCDEFFDLSEEEKLQFETKNPRFPVVVRSTVGTNPANEKTMLFWRDYIRFYVHPEFSCPHKPEQLSDLVSEYAQRTRVLAKKLIGGISESLGLEEDYIEKTMDMESMTQIFVVNCYPPCPDPESAIGILPHTDPGLLTFLLQNGVGGLEIQHDGKWFHLNAIPGSIFVNTSGQLEIVSNGKYKSVCHRAVVNKSKKRISLAVANGPSPDTMVAPASLLISDSAPAKYAPMSYMEYIEVQRSTRPPEKPILDRLKLY